MATDIISTSLSGSSFQGDMTIGLLWEAGSPPSLRQAVHNKHGNPFIHTYPSKKSIKKVYTYTPQNLTTS